MVINSIFKHNFSLHRYFIWNNRNILYKHKSSFLRTGLTTILNCLVSYKTKKEHSYEFLSYCKISIPQREFSIVIGSIPSGTHVLGINKDHSPNSASLDVTNVCFFTLVKCVFHEVIIKLFVLFFKEKLLLYLMFLSYWNSLLNGKLICWRKVWLLPQKYHRRNKIKEVSYKLIHRF